jgi:biopolymer transport protein TolR
VAGNVHAPSRPSTRGRRVASTLAEINVIPLVDVMLVLLIIFMVTAPMIQRGIDVNLPQSRRATSIDGERIFITVPTSYKTDGALFVGDERLASGVWRERVRQKMETAKEKQVYLRGDGAVQLQELYAIIDALKDAGVETVGILAKKEGEL